MVKGMQEVMDVMEKVKGDLAAQGGLKQVIFVACGGSFASCLNRRPRSTFIHYISLNSESEPVSCHPRRSLLPAGAFRNNLFCSSPLF